MNEQILKGATAPVNVMGTYIDWEALGLDPACITVNSERVKARIKVYDGDYITEPVAIVGSGASIKEMLSIIKDFKIIYSCSGAHRFLLDNGIVPTYHVDCDPRAYKADIIGDPDARVTYLIASCCHPTYFDKLEYFGADVKLWHVFFSSPPKMITYYPFGDWIFTGGHIVGPRTVKIARLMGYTNLHIFGLDSSLGAHGASHAMDHPNPPMDFYVREVGGKKYLTNEQWEKHARVLLEDLDHLPEVSYAFYGDGLMQAMAKEHVRTVKPYRALRIMIESNEMLNGN